MAQDKKTILIIDDEADLVEMIGFQLKAKGYNVLSAYNGKEGLAVLEDSNPDLIVLDVNMPEMGGIEFLTKITGEDLKLKYPVLVLTARANLEATFKDINVEGFMPKPFEINKLLDEIGKIISQAQRPEPVKKIEPEPEKKRTKKIIFLIDFIASAHVKEIKEALESADFEVVNVEDYDTFYKEAHKKKPDLIIMEYMQKGMNGNDFIKRIKQEPTEPLEKIWPALHTISVVVYSYSGFDYSDKSLQAGASKYLGKPSGPDDLLNQIKKIL